MANAFDAFSTTKFKRDIVVDRKHCERYIKKTIVTPNEVEFTVHIPFEQLKSWYETKQTTLVDYSYVQILNEFIGKKYLLKIRENFSRGDECLRLNCTRVAKKFIGQKGRRRENLFTQVKSIAIRQDEISTVGSVALLNELENQVSRLEDINATISRDNKEIGLKYKEVSKMFSQTQTKIDKATVDIDELKEENNSLYNIIEKLSPQMRFEDKGKTVSEVGKRQQDRKLKILATRIEQALWFSESFGLHLESANLISSDSGKPHSISFEEKGLKSYKELPNVDQENIQQVLHIMDRFCIGEAAYHELTCCTGGEALPRSYLVKVCKDDLNKQFYIERTPGNANGAALNFEDELSCVIEKLVRLLINRLFRLNYSGMGM